MRSATKVKNDIIESAKNLKIIGRAGAGVDNIDIESAKKNNIDFEVVEPQKRKITKKSYADNFIK